MANITELQLQGDSTVYKLNDARITTSAVSTATHFLATDSSISSIAPITAANLASVLGVPNTGAITDANAITSTGFYTNLTGAGYVERNFPDGYGILLHFNTQGYYPYVQIYIAQSGLHLWVRTKEPMGGPWCPWNKIV